jgi:hypothetical protein
MQQPGQGWPCHPKLEGCNIVRGKEEVVEADVESVAGSISSSKGSEREINGELGARSEDNMIHLRPMTLPGFDEKSLKTYLT